LSLGLAACDDAQTKPDGGHTQGTQGGGTSVQQTPDGEVPPEPDGGPDSGRGGRTDAGPDDGGSDPAPNTYPCEVRTQRVLFLYGGGIDSGHDITKHARRVLYSHLVEYDGHPLDQELDFEVEGAGRYAAIVISDYEAYQDLAPYLRTRLDDYARSCDVGMHFLQVGPKLKLGAGDVATGPNARLSRARVETESPLLSLTRDGGTLSGALPGEGRLFDLGTSEGYQAVAWASSGDDEEAPYMLADLGEHDGIRRVFNGRVFDTHFLNDLLFIDAIAWLSPVDLNVFRQRYVGVDVDDIFQPNHAPEVDDRIVKIQADDVEEMLATQERISNLIGSDFRYVLGVNVGFYGEQYADPAIYDDVAGDLALVENRSAFYWFDHLPNHTEIWSQTTDEIRGLMLETHAWAEETGVIDFIGTYAVTPKHSGISQMHTPLYESWREVWDIQYSSDTSGAGLGFEYMGILVAPRARANIWAAQYAFSEVDRSTITSWAHGGSIYRGVIDRPVSIFMTHQANYARDGIGNYLWEQLFEFIARWTRYEMRSGTPESLVEKHFEHFPLEE
jgi:hypothetical protein